MLTLPLAVIGAILIPPERGAAGVVPTHSNLKRFDVVGVSILTGAKFHIKFLDLR